MVGLPAGQPLLAVPVARGRLAARAVGAAHRRDRLAGPPPGGLTRAAWISPPCHGDVERFHRAGATSRGGPNAKENPMCAADHSHDPLSGDTAPRVPDNEVAVPHTTRCRPRAGGRHADPSAGGPGPGRDAEPLKVPK